MNARSLGLLTLVIGLYGCSSGDDQTVPDIADPLATLAVETDLAVLGADCDYGGVRTDTGTDQNRDNVLQPAEVTDSSINCAGPDSPQVDAALRSLVIELGIDGNPLPPEAQFPSIESPLAQLGMQLFFSMGLSGDMDTACASCHHPTLGGGDGLALPVGVAAESPHLLGPGRRHRAGAAGFDGGPTMPRNAPTIFNIALWQRTLFHDGRIELLPGVAPTHDAPDIRTPDVALGSPDPQAGPNLVAALARFPVTPEVEMRGFEFEAGNSNQAVRDHLERRFQGIVNELPRNEWLPLFRSAFDRQGESAETLLTFDNIALALAEYEQSQIFADTPFRRYMAGDDSAMTPDAKLGALLFYGDAGCSDCHSGDFMTDEQFHVLGMPQVGRGKDDDNGESTLDDFGRYRETGHQKDRYAFRTPTLVNVAVTGPWSHAGAYSTLEAVVEHHLDPHAAVQNYDRTQLEAGILMRDFETNMSRSLAQLDALRANGTSMLPVVNRREADVARLVSFLEHLTDSCVRDPQCLSPWSPSPEAPDPDGLLLRPVDQHGIPLRP